MPAKHSVKAGECLSSIAFERGLTPEAIWNDSANEKLRTVREDPNQLVPGDSLVIPDLRRGEVSGGTNTRHRLRLKNVPAKLRLRVFDGEEPRANQGYVLEVDGERLEGTSDAEGLVDEWIAPDAGRAKLIIGDDQAEFELTLGALQPPAELKGVQARLKNLGFSCEASGKKDAATIEAIKAFQSAAGIEVTGEPDDATVQALADCHDEASGGPPKTPDGVES